MLFKSRLHPIWRGSARPPSAQESKGLSPVRVISGFKRRARRCLLWIEDRAGSIIAVIVAVWLTALGLLLLSSWALAVSIAISGSDLDYPGRDGFGRHSRVQVAPPPPRGPHRTALAGDGQQACRPRPAARRHNRRASWSRWPGRWNGGVRAW
jgi:hypothetical protein